MSSSGASLELKTEDEILLMRQAGRLAARALQVVREAVRPPRRLCGVGSREGGGVETRVSDVVIEVRRLRSFPSLYVTRLVIRSTPTLGATFNGLTDAYLWARALKKNRNQGESIFFTDALEER